MCKRAWGESLDICDSSDLLDQLAPSFVEAIAAVDDRTEAAGILVDLHRKCSSSDSELVTTLLRTLRGEIVEEDADFLWRDYELHLRELESDFVEVLLEMYERAIHAVTDPEKLAPSVFEVCDDTEPVNG